MNHLRPLLCIISIVIVVALLAPSPPVQVAQAAPHAGVLVVRYIDPQTVDLFASLTSDYPGEAIRIRRDDGKILGAFSSPQREMPVRDSGLSGSSSHSYYLERVSAQGGVVQLATATATLGPTHGAPLFSIDWSGGTYSLDGEVTLKTGITLSIEPGTIVELSAACSASYICNINLGGGALQVDGATFRGAGDGYRDLTIRNASSTLDSDLVQSRVSIVNSTFEETLSVVNIVAYRIEQFTGNSGAAPLLLDILAPLGDLSVQENRLPNGDLFVDFSPSTNYPFYQPDGVPLALNSLTVSENEFHLLRLDGCTSYSGYTCQASFAGPIAVRNNQGDHPAFELVNLDSPQITIENNQATAGDMSLTFGGTGPFERTIRHNSGFSIRLSADHVTISKNALVCGVYNIVLRIEGNDNQVQGNAIRCASGTGIQLGEYMATASNTVASNTVNAPIGLRLQNTTQNHIYDNIFWGSLTSGGVVSVDFASTQNQIKNNVLVSAAPPLSSGNVCSNTWNGPLSAGANIVGGPNRGGNYWVSYPGSDANGDGIGDTPYNFLSGCGDQYPLVAASRPELSVVPFAFNPLDVILTGTHYLLPLDIAVQNSGVANAANVSVYLSDTGGWSATPVLTQVVAGGQQILHAEWDLTPLLLAGEGLADASLRVQVDPANAIAEWNENNNTAASQISLDARPRLRDIRSQYTLAGAYFLATESVPNRLNVLVDWNGALPGSGSAPYGEVVFELNGVVTREAGLDWGAAHSYDLGAEFASSFECANNLLRLSAVQPVAGGELRSLEAVLQPTVFPFPGWVQWAITHLPGADASFETRLAAPLVEYQYDFQYPEEPFEATWTPPTWIPYLGGQEVGILPTQGGFDLLGCSNGLGMVEAEGATGLGLAALTAEGRVFGNGETRFVCGESLDLTRAELGFEIQATVEQEMGLVDLIPAVSAAEDWPVVGRIIRWVNESAAVKGSFTPAVALLTVFEEQNDALAFVSGEGTGRIQARAELAVAPIEDLSASVYGGGEPYLTIQVPAAPDYLKEMGINLFYGATFQAWSFESEYERRVNCQFPGACDEALAQARSAPGWQIIPHNYALGYAAFSPLAAAVANGETILLSDVYPRPQPALALSGAQRRLAYVHDDPADPAGRGTEIHLLSYNGSTWAAPVAITSDQQPDYAPALATDGAGRGVLLWERSTLSTGITPTLNITFAQSLEIQTCAWNGSACIVPTALTNNALMDYAPQVAALSNGNVLALWQSGDGSDVMGTSDHPLTLTTALWNNAAASWGAPQTAITNLYDLTGVAFAAYSPTRAAVVYARDVDGDLLTPDDSELFASTYDGASWTAPTRVTSDTLPDSSPALAYDAAGALHLAWLRAGKLAWLNDSWDIDARQTLQTASEGGFIGFQLLRAANGNLALVWQTLDGSGPNLAYRLYDATNADWSAPRALLSDAASESACTAALSSAGSLYLAYQKMAVEWISQTVTISPTLTVTTTNVPTPGPSDLVFLAHTVGRDLAWDSLLPVPVDAQPGETVTLTAVLRNAGDLTVLAPQVAFYEGATLLGSIQTLSALPAGYTATVTTTWTLPPAVSAAYTLHAVADPNAQVSETDESNNQATVGVNLPNLAVDAFFTQTANGTLTAIARLRNDGGSGALMPFTVTLRADDALNGVLLDQIATPILAAGEAVTLTLVLTDSVLPEGVEVLGLFADSAAQIAESDETDNTSLAPAGLLPDLTIIAEDVINDGGLSVTVHNTGLAAVTGVPVEVREGGLSGTLLYSGTAAAIPAGGVVTLPVYLPIGRYTLFVKADAPNIIAERDESNNLAIRVLTMSTSVYLPLIMRGQ